MKWFAGGKERKDNALEILKDLYDSFSEESSEKQVKDLIAKYILEFKSPNRPVPYILNSFNLEISKCLRDNRIKLNSNQSQALKKIRQLSNIKYAYSI